MRTATRLIDKAVRLAIERGWARRPHRSTHIVAVKTADKDGGELRLYVDGRKTHVVKGGNASAGFWLEEPW